MPNKEIEHNGGPTTGHRALAFPSGSMHGPARQGGASRWLGRKSVHEVRMLLKDMLLKDGQS
jgi:hypothetical protein